jgi:hypothetical protein
VRIRTAVVLIAMAVLLITAKPASAQEKGAANLGLTYTNLTNFDPTQNVPAGWLASIGVGVSKRASFVGEVGGNYDKIGGVWVKQHSFQGGLRMLSTTNEKMTPFFQVVTGVTHFTGADVWTLTPGGGVDSKINDKIAFRIQGDWVYMRDSGVSQNGLRVGGGLVINMRKQ